MRKRCSAPSLHEGFDFIENHSGTYTLIMYVTNDTRLVDGSSLATYNRSSLLAVVNHLEWFNFPGSRFDSSGEHFPLHTAMLISNKYLWSVLKSFNSMEGKSPGILAKFVSGKCSHFESCLPMGPVKPRGPDVDPSRFCTKCLSGSSFA